ncbi:ABC-type spermidine/putrescine transport system permease subunit I [Rhodoligotrophos appendicifer]|uniref:ABC transporter permease n=1 Tax=Rhodoligotrophos appendicifer TaxID=987056 RepID=UPI0011800D7A|nr:ABC transporter permease [Rhodoligotrophos appendicifer]
MPPVPKSDAAASPPHRLRRRAWSPSRGNALLLLPPLLLLTAFFIVPLATVFIQSLSGDTLGLTQYREVVTNGATVSVLLYTFQVALQVTLGALILSYPVAFMVSRLRGNLLHLCLGMILIPFWTSTVIRTYAWIVILQRRGVLNEAFMDLGLIEKPLRLVSNGVGMQIAMMHIMLPFMILPLLSAMRGIDGNLLRAASVMGANPWRQFVSVYLPLSLPGISAGCVLVFITSLGFYITPALLGGQRTMVAVLIEQQASRLLNWPLASALATILLILTCALFILYERALRSTGGGRPAGETA